jgi:4-hydroxybenzoate polyprenyltransferase
MSVMHAAELLMLLWCVYSATVIIVLRATRGTWLWAIPSITDLHLLYLTLGSDMELTEERKQEIIKLFWSHIGAMPLLQRLEIMSTMQKCQCAMCIEIRKMFRI